MDICRSLGFLQSLRFPDKITLVGMAPETAGLGGGVGTLCGSTGVKVKNRISHCTILTFCVWYWESNPLHAKSTL